MKKSPIKNQETIFEVDIPAGVKDVPSYFHLSKNKGLLLYFLFLEKNFKIKRVPLYFFFLLTKGVLTFLNF